MQLINRNEHGIFYVDGSHLFACIERVKRDHPELASSKLNIERLTFNLITIFRNFIGSGIRITYYFRKDDDRIKKYLTISPLHGLHGHWQIKQCGYNLRRSKAILASELDKLSEEYRDIYPRAEKGVDMELACDALSLAAGRTAQSFVFLIDDRDYLPLLQAIQRFGANTYIVGLDIKQKVQDSILELADSYLTLEPYLYDIFDYRPPVVESKG